MSIKPVDFNVMLPKTQEVSISKHIENVKNQNIVGSEFIVKDKNFQRDKKRVNNTEKSEHSKIDTKKRFKEESSKGKKSKDEKEEAKKRKTELGSKIDIRI